MRTPGLVAALAALLVSQAMAQSPSTYCITDIRGNQVCSGRAGQCMLDRYRVAWCAPENGSAMKDRYDEVVCGAGVCVIDRNGDISCAAQAGGATSTDPTGKTLCEGGCVPASKSACRRVTQN